MRFLSYLFFCLFVPACVLAQGTKKVEWEQSFGGPSWDMGRSIVALQDGGFIVAGYTHSEETKSDGWILKLDVTGKKIWEKKLGGNKTDRFYGLALDTNGGFAAVGCTNSKGAGNMDALGG